MVDQTAGAFTAGQMALSMRRLELVAWVTILAWSMGFLIDVLLVDQVGGRGWRPVDTATGLASVLTSAALIAAYRSNALSHHAAAGVGLFYVVLVPLLMATGGASSAWWTEMESLRAVPWFCLWILFVPMIVPTRFATTVQITLAMSLSGPISLMYVPRLLGLPPATLQAYLDTLVPTLISAVMALIAARVMHRLGEDAREALDEAQEARRAGSYVLERLLGEGGMGEVWLARHRMLVRPAAVKLIRAEADTAEARDALHDRFNREAQATAALTSVHTVELYDYGLTQDGSLYYAMEFLDGLDADRLVREFGPLPAGRVIHLLSQATESLADAHDAGLVHRDIKPANLFVCQRGLRHDFVKVLDFGLVKTVREASTNPMLTAETGTLGTPAFMAPEQIEGSGDLDGRADIYSLGCVAFWLLTGRLVFEADTAMRMVVAHLSTPAPAPSTCTDLRVPPALDALVLQCLAKDRGDRPATAALLREALSAIETDGWSDDQATRWWARHQPRARPEVAPAEGGGRLLRKELAP